MPIGPIMCDIAGTTLTQQDIDVLQNPLIGGIILFKENFVDAEQIAQLIYSIRNCRKDPILIAVDQEGGRVQRFQEGFTQLPPNRVFGELFETDPEKALNVARELGWLMASEMLAVGVDISFAPVLDLDTGKSKVIATRGFHAEPEKITELAAAYIEGMHLAGMAATGKHFPGHGSVKEDSHIAMPIDKREMKDIAKKDLIPFIDLAALLDGIMPAHVIYEKVDKLPAGFSETWLQEILREDLYFSGVIFSDDLTMKGAEVMGNMPTRAKEALSAGCDMILICHDRQGVLETIDALQGYNNPRANQRLLKLCGRFNITLTELQQSSEWLNAQEAISKLHDKL